MWQAVDRIPLLNCDLNIKQAAAVTLKLLSAPQGVTWVVDLGQTAAVKNAEATFRYRWCESEENVQNVITVVKAVIKAAILHWLRFYNQPAQFRRIVLLLFLSTDYWQILL